MIPDSVIIINDYAFSGCTNLTEVTIPDSVSSIGWWAFKGCTSLTEVTIPDSVRHIYRGAFYGCTNLTEVTIPDRVTSIEYKSFEECTSLTKVTIPDSVTSIEEAAFYGCESLKDVYYSGTKEQWEKIDIGIYNEPLNNATIHCASSGDDPTDDDTKIVVEIPLPEKDAPEITDVQATAKVGEDEITLTVGEDGSLDITDIPDGTYTFTFTANICTPRTYEVTISGGAVTKGLEDGVELHLIGDINGDGSVNTQDVARANAHVKGTNTLKGYELACINVNNDININVQDVALMNAHAKNTKKLWGN